MIQLRDYQKQAVDFLMYNYRGMVHAPAGSGKTIMMAAAADRLIDEAIGIDRIVCMANTVEQCQQIQAAMDTFDIGGRVDLQIGCAASKLDTINADLLIVDECHHGPAPTWASQIGLATNWLWGFTATPFDRDEDRNSALREMFGPVFEIGRHQLVDDGHLTKAEVRWLSAHDDDVSARIIEHKNDLFEQRKRRYPFLFYGDGAVEQERKCHWQAASKIGLCENHKRTVAIIETALREGDKSVLILVSKIEYGKDLRDQLPFSELCHSKMGKAKRRRVIELFKSGELPILIATTLADEGLDVPCAEVLIIANAGRSATKLEQRTGRVLRPYPGKERGIIYDFRDSFDPMLRAQAYKRRRIYQKLKYENA